MTDTNERLEDRCDYLRDAYVIPSYALALWLKRQQDMLKKQDQARKP